MPSRNAPEGHLIYFTTEQDARLRKAAKHQGVSLSSIVRDGAMRVVREVEEDIRKTKEVQEEKKRKAFVPRNAQSPKGLGLRRSDRDREEQRSDYPVPPVSPTVIVNTGGNNLVEKLANYIIGASGSLDREERERQVEKMIRATAASQVEAEQLAAELDERLKRQSKKSSFSWLTGR